MAKKPKINTNPVANRSAGENELIVEFNSGVPNGPGGLISFRRMDDGSLRVDLYRLDSGVKVVTSEPDRTVLRTRVAMSTGDPGRWQAQYRDANIAQWFDIGDSTETQAEAEEKAAEYERGRF